MTRNRIIIRLFLASPGDVSNERNIVGRVVGQLNTCVAPQLGIMVELVRWEDFVPGMGRPQSVIFDQAGIEECDIFVGILWNRFGTPTGHADSGTEEEFQVAYSWWEKKGKPEIMFYFCNKSSSLDTRESLRQKEKIIDFKETITGIGFHREYTETSDFETLLRNNLTSHLFKIHNNPKVNTEQNQSFTGPRFQEIEPRLTNIAKKTDLESMVRIPKGDFRYGESGKITKISYDYYIDLTPVTNIDFAIFLKESNYMLEYESFSQKERIERIFRNAKEIPQHPIAAITWNDAVAYAAWIGKRLPTNLEWEKAARGENGMIYPWGNEFDKDKCNSKESTINQTTNVYKYEKGRSPYGCYDMAGNVFEWVDDWSRTPRFTDLPFTEKYNRGASYNRKKANLYTWYYESDPPDLRMTDVGFRCVYVET